MVDVLFAILFGGLAVFCLSFLTEALRTGQVVIFSRTVCIERAHLSTTTTCLLLVWCCRMGFADCRLCRGVGIRGFLTLESFIDAHSPG
jgi:hypothetical protein